MRQSRIHIFRSRHRLQSSKLKACECAGSAGNCKHAEIPQLLTIAHVNHLYHTRYSLQRLMGDGRSGVLESDQPDLAHDHHDAGKGKATVLLIHGASSSGREWTKVIPHLADKYQVLQPDVPAHGASKDVAPFSKEASARSLADLIRDRGANGKAHVVGHSLGAHVAMEIASKHPDVVSKVFVSGYEVFSSPQTLAYGLWLQDSVVAIAPRSLVRWMTDGTDLPPSTTATSFARCKAIAKVMCPGEDGWPQPWPSPTLIVAAGKSGILPTADHPEDAKRLRDIGRKANGDTVAYTHPDMRHPWNLQAPELFARTVIQWIEDGTVPEGFQLL